MSENYTDDQSNIGLMDSLPYLLWVLATRKWKLLKQYYNFYPILPDFIMLTVRDFVCKDYVSKRNLSITKETLNSSPFMKNCLLGYGSLEVEKLSTSFKENFGPRGWNAKSMTYLRTIKFNMVWGFVIKSHMILSKEWNSAKSRKELELTILKNRLNQTKGSRQ